MFEKTAGSYVVKGLKQWNVDHLYGMPGDSINHFMEELRKEDAIRFIQVRHEETGALAAAAYAKLTGHIGVCMAITGPGAIHLQNGLYDAKMDKVPVLAIVGQVSSEEVGTDTFQEVKLESMFEEVAVFNRRVQTAEQLPDMLHQAIKTAYARKGPAVLIVSDDLFKEKVKREMRKSSPVYTAPRIYAPEEELKKAMELISSSQKTIVLAGKGVHGAVPEFLAFVEKLKAPFISSFPSKGMIPDDHPQNLGHLGQLGTEPAKKAMKEADLLLLAGTAYPYRDYLPENAPAIQIDIDPLVLGKYYPADVGITSDAGTALVSLTERIGERNSDFLETCLKMRADWHKHLDKERNKQTDDMQPQHMLTEIQRILEKEAIVSLDVGSVTLWSARYLVLSGQKMVVSSWLATMGCGLPGAIAAKIAFPERQVVAIIGDGGFSMGMQDFVTAVKYDLPMTIVVMNNQKIQLIEHEQAEIGNEPTGIELANIDFAAFARACGGEGYTVETQEQLGAALQQAKNSKKPVVIDAYVEDISPETL
ncbi:pyruvate oxidase [Planomicrobium sp. YIM 101495]|uniref:pyruvate oxidase n=1 Tax=Planomicrobium sp. YIM 101495 TaxID=2665160 RepID=UPI0012B76266|nr:pyruvate oxidase [Planomicrobium sp. YIM 101495]MTD29872.1 pyruvate oxidase [Planomicrobium sp. YIM 101495]